MNQFLKVIVDEKLVVKRLPKSLLRQLTYLGRGYINRRDKTYKKIIKIKKQQHGK